MTAADHDMIDRVLEREGGFVDNPFDKGGPTNKGITIKTLENHLGHPPTLAELREITTDMARDIYFTEYVVVPNFDKIEDLGLREILFDAGVNNGPGNAVKQMQRALNRWGITPPLKVDGVLGPKTLEKVNGLSTDESRLLRRDTLAQRLRFFGSILVRNPEQRVFAAGWINRLADLMEIAG